MWPAQQFQRDTHTFTGVNTGILDVAPTGSKTQSLGSGHASQGSPKAPRVLARGASPGPPGPTGPHPLPSGSIFCKFSQKPPFRDSRSPSLGLTTPALRPGQITGSLGQHTRLCTEQETAGDSRRLVATSKPLLRALPTAPGICPSVISGLGAPRGWRGPDLCARGRSLWGELQVGKPHGVTPAWRSLGRTLSSQWAFPPSSLPYSSRTSRPGPLPWESGPWKPGWARA